MNEQLIHKIHLQFQPSKEDRTADIELLQKALHSAGYPAMIPYALLRRQYAVIRESGYNLTATLVHTNQWQVVRLEPGNTTHCCYLLAVDLGSTTVSMRLLDGLSNKVLSEETCRNGQRAYGEDILSRIFYTKDSPERRAELQQITAATLNGLVESVCCDAGISPDDCCAMAVAGNTTMIHFLLGLDAFCIFHAPFIPMVNHPGWINAQEIGVSIPGPVYCFPSTANYLGGDITSGLLSVDMPHQEGVSRGLDIGTPGEMVIGGRDVLIGGAGAAGPALEGGISRSGMRAREGAIDTVSIENGALTYTVIGGGKPLGICGSGIVDLLAQMLLAGWMDRQGTLQPNASSRIRQIDGIWAVVYADAEESGSDQALVFTQHDIQQFTDTKAAAHTMVAILLQESGIELSDVDRIYLAGAFGRHLNLESAITIGLYPDVPRDKFVQAGNSSLQGACDLLTGCFTVEDADCLPSQIYYLEFAMQPDFLSLMRAASFYPHTDLRLYPTVAKRLSSYRVPNDNSFPPE